LCSRTATTRITFGAASTAKWLATGRGDVFGTSGIRGPVGETVTARLALDIDAE